MPDLTSLNATSSTMMTNSIDGGAMLMLFVCIVGLAALMLLITSLERYTKFFDTLEKLLYTIKYTLIGGGVVAIGFALYVVCIILSKVGLGIDPITVVELIGAYVVITVVGYAATKAWDRIKNMHRQYVASKEVTPTL